MKTLIGIVLVYLIFASLLSAQPRTKIIAGGFYGNPDDRFGWSVDIDGNYAIVGTPYDDFNFTGTEVGSVTIYKYNGNEWIEHGFIRGARAGDIFGESISIDGEFAFIGSPNGKPSASNPSGIVCVLKREASIWTVQDWIYPSSLNGVRSFGKSVALHGEYAVIGDPAGFTDGKQSGTAYIYELENGFWVEKQKLFSNPPNIQESFGESVAIYEDYAVVGAPNADSIVGRSGIVYLYKLESDTWIYHGALFSNDQNTWDRFGESVSIHDDYIIVGSPGDDDNGNNSGSAYIFYNDGSDWIEHQKLTAFDGSENDFFGQSVSINENAILIGAPYADGNDSEDGAAYLYKRNGTDWIFHSKLTSNYGDPDDRTGFCVALDNSSAVVGSPRDYNNNGWNAGAAYIFQGISEGFMSVLPNALDFGDVFVGLNDTRGLMVKNEGLEELNVTSLVLSGPSAANFSVDPSPFSLAPEQSKTLAVTFSPTSLDTFFAELEIVSDGGDKTIPVSGSGSPPLSVQPGWMYLGNVPIASHSKDTVIIKNVDVTQFTIDSVVIKDFVPNLPVFTTTVITPFVLEPDSTKEVEVKFIPADEVGYSAKLFVYSSIGTDSVGLSASGYYAGNLRVYSDSITFGDVLTGYTGYDSVRVGNNGFGALNIDSMTITGPNNFTANPTSFFLYPTNIEPVYLNFTPNTGGQFISYLNIYSSGGNDTVKLIGKGISSGILDVTPDTLFFGDLPVGFPKKMTLFIANWGYIPLNISSFVISGTHASNFSALLAPLTIDPGGIERLDVTFIPSAGGTHSAELKIFSDAENLIVPLIGTGIACTPNFENLVIPNDPQDMGSFGRSVSVDGFNAVIGSTPFDQIGGAYVFRCNQTGFSQVDKLTPTYAEISDEFGYSVDISGYNVVVGSPAHNDSGAAYLFNYGGVLGGWHLLDTLFSDGYSNSVYDRFGESVAIDGDVAIVGSPESRVLSNTREGIAYIFGISSPGIADWHLLDRLTSFDGTAHLKYGISVDISDDFVIVGTNGKGAYIYQRVGGIGTDWYFREKLISSDYQPPDGFGNPVAISRDIAMVGAPMAPNGNQEGAVYVFERNGTHWIETYKIVSPLPVQYQQFGISISLSDHYALIGTWDSERVYLYRRLINGNWELVETFQDDWVDPSDGYGYCVGLDAFSLTGIIGIRNDFVNASFSGSAIIYSGLPLVSVDNKKKSGIPEEFGLSQNYPNPFNPTTKIDYSLPKQSIVSIKIYDILGQEVRTLINTEKPAGYYEIEFNAANLSSGVYFYRLKAGNFIETKKLLLLK